MEGGTEPMVSFTLVQIERKKTEEGYDNSISFTHCEDIICRKEKKEIDDIVEHNPGVYILRYFSIIILIRNCHF